MSKISVGLVVVAIICMTLGVWPVSVAAIGALIYVTKFQHLEEPKKKKSIEELERENEALRQELATQAVQHAMDKAESREKKD